MIVLCFSLNEKKLRLSSVGHNVVIYIFITSTDYYFLQYTNIHSILFLAYSFKNKRSRKTWKTTPSKLLKQGENQWCKVCRIWFLKFSTQKSLNRWSFNPLVQPKEEKEEA